MAIFESQMKLFMRAKEGSNVSEFQDKSRYMKTAIRVKTLKACLDFTFRARIRRYGPSLHSAIEHHSLKLSAGDVGLPRFLEFLE